MSKPGEIVRVPSRTPSRTPTRGGRGPGRKGPPRRPLARGTLLKGGAFRILGVLGEGGFSITYLGLEGSRQVTVAIKELFPLGCVRDGLNVVPANHWEIKSFDVALADFINEGKVLKFFTHPGIVQSYSPFEENGTAYLAMEYLQGESLLLGLQRRGAMNQTQAMEFARQLGGALELAHQFDVIHSDIKPENIIHTDDGRFVLLDFGVSRRNSPDRTSKIAVVAVSPPYSPPEQYQASKPLTPATDVYSLAATIYTTLSFSMPPDAISREKGEPLASLLELNPTVTQPFWAAIAAGMELDPARRPQLMSDFIFRLEGAAPATAHAAPPPPVGAAALAVAKSGEFDAHRGGIYRLLLHPHLPILISGARNGSIGLWKWPTGEPKGLLKAHETGLTGLAISPDGTLLATAGEPGEVKLWLVDRGQMLRTLGTGLPPVFCLAFSQDSQTIAIAMADGTVHLYTPQREEPNIMPCHLGAVNAVAFSPDSKMMATAGHDGVIKIWDTRTAIMITELTGHGRPILHIEFSPDSKLLISGSKDYTTRMWEVAASLEIRRFRGDGANIWTGTFTSDPDVVAIANGDKKLCFFRLSTGREVYSIEGDKNYLRTIACDRHHPVLASGGGDGRIRIWRFLS